MYLKPVLFNIHSIESGVPQIHQIFFFIFASSSYAVGNSAVALISKIL